MIMPGDRFPVVVVGSAALWLRGEPVSVGDVDVVIEPGEANRPGIPPATAPDGDALSGWPAS
jgi:hypothetical protein